MPKYWCVNFDDVSCLEHGIDRKTWMMQYQYADALGNVFQGATSQRQGRVTENWQGLKQITGGDRFVAYLKSNKFYAIGTVVRPRRPATHTDPRGMIDNYVERKLSHEYSSGFVYYTPVFFEDFSDVWRHPDRPLERYAQRIEVDDWQYYVPNGVSIKGLLTLRRQRIRSAAFEINEKDFERIEKRLELEHERAMEQQTAGATQGFITSRGNLPTDAGEMIELPWYNMWAKEQWPYQKVKEGDTLYWYDSTQQAIVWQSRVGRIERFRYGDKTESQARIAGAFGNADFNNEYFNKAANQGFCIAYKIHSLNRLNVPRPSGVDFPRLGWLKGSDAKALKWLTDFRARIPRDDSTQTDLSHVADEIDSSGYFSPMSLKDEREKAQAEIVKRRGQPKFRETLIFAYNGRCVVTGCDAREALEAAHIIPYTGPESHHVTNGLLLRSDIHTLFDLHLLGVHPTSRTIVLAPAIRRTVYAELHGRKLRVPAKEAFSPHSDALNQRWNDFENGGRTR